jgi:hypothetical protein
MKCLVWSHQKNLDQSGLHTNADVDVHLQLTRCRKVGLMEQDIFVMAHLEGTRNRENISFQPNTAFQK